MSVLSSITHHLFFGKGDHRTREEHAAKPGNRDARGNPSMRTVPAAHLGPAAGSPLHPFLPRRPQTHPQTWPCSRAGPSIGCCQPSVFPSLCLWEFCTNRDGCPSQVMTHLQHLPTHERLSYKRPDVMASPTAVGSGFRSCRV